MRVQVKKQSCLVLNGKVVYAKNAGMLANVVIQHEGVLIQFYSHLDEISPTLKIWVRLMKLLHL